MLIVMLCALSAARNSAWHSEESLLEDAVRKTPDKPRPYYNLGCVYSDNHEYLGAAAMFTRAIELYRSYNSGDNERSRDFHFYAYLHRGSAYAGSGRLEKAVEDYTRALSLRPGDAGAHLFRGAGYGELGDRARALRDYQEACDLGSVTGCAALRFGKLSDASSPR